MGISLLTITKSHFMLIIIEMFTKTKKQILLIKKDKLIFPLFFCLHPKTFLRSSRRLFGCLYLELYTTKNL